MPGDARERARTYLRDVECTADTYDTIRNLCFAYDALQRKIVTMKTGIKDLRARLAALEQENAGLRVMEDVPAFNAGWEIARAGKPCPTEDAVVLRGLDISAQWPGAWTEALEMGWLWFHSERARELLTAEPRP